MAKIAKKATGRGQAPELPKKAPTPENEARRMLTAAEYRALEKAAHALETALRIRRKYQFAITNATECVEKNLDKLMRIARGDAGQQFAHAASPAAATRKRRATLEQTERKQ